MRCLIKRDGKWEREDPPDLAAWLWANDGAEAVCVDDATHTYFCSREEDATRYREAWQKENRANDQRRASSFYELFKKIQGEK